MVFCFGTNQKKFQALEFLPRLKSFLSCCEKRTPDRRLLLNKNGLTFCSHSTMSNFRKFVLPRLLTKRPDPCNDGIARFDCNKLSLKDRIGHGSFGDVYTADYQAPGTTTTETVVIKKMLNALDPEENKLFLKEVALLNSIDHRNVVKFMKVCHQPPAIMLEYVYFDFNIFGQDVRVNALSDFLLKINEHNCTGFQELVNHAATEIIDGLAYLHSHRIAHRDLKTANILVSNQHYISLSTDSEEFEQMYRKRPIACKLTDFGESRSLLIQTQAVLSSKTTTVDRGTVVFMAPELLVKEKLIQNASVANLILADLWALGMIFFTMLNPSLKTPYVIEVRSEGVNSQEQLKKFIRSLLEEQKHPLQDVKYDIDRATVWYDLEKVYRGFTNFDRNRRLSLQEAGHILRRRHERSRDLQVVNLKVSQATALEEFDARVAAGMEEHCKTKESMTTPSNDGTNACAFISVGVAESILHDTETEAFFENLPKAVEVTILSIPEEINKHRDMGKNYDILEAYEILRRQHLIRFPLQFSEELPYADGVFTYEGREKLFTKLCALGAERFVAIYTSDPFVLTIGCYKGKPFMIDTHPVAPPIGDGNGLLLIGNDNTPEVWMSICVSLWQRLHHGGVDPTTAQSLSVVQDWT